MFRIEDVYKAIDGKKEFVAKIMQDTICFDYIFVTKDSFNDEKNGWILRNCRGMTFNRNTGDLISLPFHKFYNINQNDESRFELHKHKSASIYEKMDGSMIHCFRINDKLIASTCRSYENIQSADALDYIKSNTKLEKNINDSIDNGLTPIFEWIAPYNRIVVFYDKPRLVYLMSRNMKTGEYLYEEKYDIKTKKYEIDFSNILESIKNVNDFEGYVCHLECGNIFKVKSSWYLEQHRVFSVSMQVKYKIYEVALNGQMDDIIAMAPDTYKDLFVSVENEVKQDLLTEMIELDNEYNNLMDNCIKSKNCNEFAEIAIRNAKMPLSNVATSDFRKQFAISAKSSKNFSALMAMYCGRSGENIVKRRLLEKYKTMYNEKLAVTWFSTDKDDVG